MNRKNIFFIFVVIVLLIPAGYCIIHYFGDTGSMNRIEQQGMPRVTEPRKQETNTTKVSPKQAVQTPDEDPIRTQLNGMTLEEKIGQMVLVGADGYENNGDSKQMIEKYHIGGFILYKDNIKNSNQLLKLLNSLKNSNSVNKIPLFLSVDEEGGRISRMPDGFVKIPTNREIGKINNSEFSFQIGSLLGEEIKMFGFNLDFAPVLDINSNPENPIIGDRSFGSNAGIVSELGIQTMKGIQSQNVIPVVKHFPGHGDTSVDSHKGLPVVNNDMKRLENFELIPFADTIKNGADAVMVAHILLPQIDPDYPASMSKTVITDMLRKNLNFDGVVFSDDMTMGAISKNYDLGDAAVKSINAGSDIVLVCHDHDKELKVINSIRKAVDIGTITVERINESIYRILKLKSGYNLADNTIDSVNANEINNKINDILHSYIN